MSEMPRITIPATPELIMNGMSAAFTPTILKCAMGGWLVIVPGKGMAGFSSLGEAINFIEDTSYDVLDEPKPMPMPQLTETWVEPEPADPPRLTWRGAMNNFLGTIALFLGVKAA